MSEQVETVTNRNPERRATVVQTCAEFTALHTVTGGPIFATVEVRYVPGSRCIETVSLRRYLASYRGDSVTCEEATNRILDDLVAACDPLEITVSARFGVRGGIETEVTVTHGRESGTG
ncbi:MAG: preQ(1) synthase [Candidatus Latescibacteria bacterium]|nr:preQ(1) synthase [Candidatus Latescibacterota bacterium]